MGTTTRRHVALRFVDDGFARFGRGHRGLWVALVSGVCGTAYTVSLIGIRALNPRDLSTLGPDTLTQYLAWTFMRQDPVTALPLTLTDRIGYPLTLSAAHFDVVPGIAVALLPFSRLLPAEFQYFGFFRCACAAALFYFGHEIARLYEKSEVMALAAGTLLMTNAVFTYRVGIHSALTGQFFLPWIIYESLKRFPPGAPREDGVVDATARRGLVIGLCATVAALAVNPYIALMTLSLVGAYAVALLRMQRDAVRFVALAFAIGGAALVALGAFLGYVTRFDDVVGSGFGVYSANLNAYVNPLEFSRFVRPGPIAGTGQAEGSAYLGIGIEGALAAAVVGCVRSPALRAHLKPLIPLFVAGFVCFILSLSNRITLGADLLGEVPFPPAARNLLAVFRASGRLTWPLFYLAVVAAIVTAATLIPRPARGISLALLALLQWVEVSPLRAAARRAPTNVAAASRFSSAAFRRLGEHHRHLVVLPAWQCDRSDSPGGDKSYAIFGLLAARQRMTINSYYSSRYSERALRVHCINLPSEVRRRGPASDTAYVVDQEFLAWFEAHPHPGHECGERDGFNLCVKRGTLY